MKLSISTSELLAYVAGQCDHFFPDGLRLRGEDVDAAFDLALERTEHCFNAIRHPGYHDESGTTVFSHLHGDQYAQFLWFMGNSLWKRSQNRHLCDKLLLLNRVLFCLFISYKCHLPDYFMLAHPFGTILGNAEYNDFLVVSQGVTVNTETDAEGNPAPVLGRGVFLGAHSKIIGNQPVGNRVSLGVGAMVYDQAIPDDSVVLFENGNPCAVHHRRKDVCKAQGYFTLEI